jgi:hypothetical protein
MSPRYRILVFAGITLLGALLVTFAGFKFAANRKVTADRVRAYVESVDFAALDPARRARAIRTLADKLNALSMEERRQARLSGIGTAWFSQMTEEERGSFLEATLPTGYKQMISAFEEMPAERRQKVVTDAVRGMREAQARMQAEGGMPPSTNAPVLSEELQKKMTAIGLKTFYSQSSAQTKAELAPLMEEMQRMMENGRYMFGGGQRERSR